jgi:hypothetical protein
VEGKEGQGAPSKTVVSFFSNRTEEGGGDRPGGRPAEVLAGSPGHGDGWEMGQNEEGDERDRFPPSPWVGAARGSGSTGSGGVQAMVVRGGGAQRLGSKKEMVGEVRGAMRSGTGYL